MPRLTDQERQEVLQLIESGQPLPVKYRSLLFEPSSVSPKEGSVVEHESRTRPAAKTKRAASQAISPRLLDNEDHDIDRLFREFFESNSSVMLLVAPESGEIVGANSAAVAFYGYSKSELLGMRIAEINTLPESEIAIELDRANREQCSFFHFKHMLASGEVRNVEVHSTPIVSGGAKLLFSIIHDTTSRTQAEAAIETMALRYKTLLDAACDGIHVMDDLGNVVEVNAAFCQMLGYSREELLTMNVADWDAKWFGDDLLNTVTGLIKNAGKVETIHRRRDGSLRDIEINAVGVELDGRRYNYSSARDITDRKQSEQAVRESLDRLLKIASQVPGVVYQYLLRPDGTSCFPFASEAIREIYRVTPEQVREDATPVFANLHPDDFDGIVESIQSSARDLTPWRHEYRVKFEDGSERYLFGNALPQREPDGSVLWHGFITDISDRRAAAEEKAMLESQLQQSQRLEALGVLVAGVAHNINNVLAAVMGSASLREKLTHDPQDLEAFKTITTACRRGRDVVNSLTQFAKPTLPQKSPLDVHGLLSEVRTLLENVTQKQYILREEFMSEPAWVLGDAGSISNAIMNLCINSIDAMPNGGELILRTTFLPDNYLEISVQDSGEGMSPEVLARVMDPFFTTKPVGKGTGLGLSMTHGVVKAHGGALTISSQLMHGTIVKIQLPRVPTPNTNEQTPLPPTELGPLKVLLVDDDEDVLLLVKRMLKVAGLSVQSVTGGEEAVEHLKRGSSPDLVILDQNMPRMNGIQTMAALREINPHLPILISSGQPEIESWPCFQIPDVSVISKPFEMDELVAKLLTFGTLSKRG